jgi:uncharacterized protein (TIGR02466 family)
MNIENWFSTPIYYSILHEPLLSRVQEELQVIYDDLILQDKFQYNVVAKSHKLSDPTFNTNFIDEYGAEKLKKAIAIHINQYATMIDPTIDVSRFKISSAWLTLNSKGSYTFTHDHGNSDISGCYYFKTNSKDGNIFFKTPNKLLSTSFLYKNIPSVVDYTPEVGKILLFPGWLEHGVHMNNSDSDRVSVSFNINFTR